MYMIMNVLNFWLKTVSWNFSGVGSIMNQNMSNTYTYRRSGKLVITSLEYSV